MKQQISVIHPYFNTIGGSEKITLSLIQTLKNADLNSTLHTFNITKDVRSYELFDESSSKYTTKRYLDSFYDIKESRTFKIKQYRRSLTPFSLLRKNHDTKKMFSSIGKEDIVIIMSGSLFLEKTDASKIFVYCNSDFSSELNFLKTQYTGLKSYYYKLIQKHVKQQLDYLSNDQVQLIANSQYTANTIENQLKKKSIVVHPPININSTDHLKRKNEVITISRFSQNKNLDFAFDVMSNIPNKWSLIASITSNPEHLEYIRLKEQYKKYQNKDIYININSKSIDSILSQYKVYFHPSPETFGMAVAESISNGCIPIVPNNTAHLETVPFNELRFNNKSEAIELIIQALEGKFDHLKPRLIENLKQFSQEIFNDKMLRILHNSLNTTSHNCAY